MFEETEAGHFEISATVSHDDGMVWGERRKIYQPPGGAAGAPQVCNVGGTMVVSFMTTEDHAGNPGTLKVESIDENVLFANTSKELLMVET